MNNKCQDNIAVQTNYLLTCVDCGIPFFSEGEKAFYETRQLQLPKRCKVCREKRKRAIADKQKQIAIQRAIETSPFHLIDKTEIRIADADKCLYVIGNGFDIIHQVPSSYYDFRDTLGKRSTLRTTLETFIKKDDIWGNFEDSLAYLDRELMLDGLDDRMSIIDVLDESDDDFSAADFFGSIEETASPVYILTGDLPRRFRQWINSLKLTSKNQPLKDIIKPNAQFINFNYTEFIEDLYGVPRPNVLYLHGDRRNKQDQLVLGHGHDTDALFEKCYQENQNREKYKPIKYGRRGKRYRNDNPTYLAYFLDDERKGNWRSQTRYDAITNTVRIIEDYYDQSAKKTFDVLEINRKYFESLGDIDTIITIGHSMSEVDYPYFERIIQNNRSPQKIQWFISWYSADDMDRIKTFVERMKIRADQVHLYRN